MADIIVIMPPNLNFNLDLDQPGTSKGTFFKPPVP